MKFKISAVMLSAVLTLVSAAGCSEEKNTDSSSDSAATKSPASFTYDWQKPYGEKLREFMNSSAFDKSRSAFDIADLTGDGSPELILSAGTDGNDKCTIYTLNGENVSEIGSIGSCGTFAYLPEKNLIKYEYIGTGFIIGYVLSCSKTELVTQLTYKDNSSSAAMGGTIYHRINDKDMLLPDYEAALAEYNNTVNITIGRRYSFGETTIDYALNYGESWAKVLNSKQVDIIRDKLSGIAKDESTSTAAAFDLTDLNGDNIPEILVSKGENGDSAVEVYYLTADTINLMEGSYGAYGVFTFDANEKIFYVPPKDGEKMNYWTLSNTEFDPSSYTKGVDVIVCGRRYALTDAGISAVFS